MPNIEFPGVRVFQLRLHYELHGQNCENGYWFSSADGCGNTYDTVLDELNALIAQFKNTVFLNIQTFMTDDCHFQRLDGTTKTPSEGPFSTFIFNNQAGANANDALPGFNAAVLSLYTNKGGRKNRGRSYYGGVPEDLTSSGILEPTSLDQLTAIGDELMTRFGPQNPARCWSYMLFHQTAHSNGVPFQDALEVITLIKARKEIRSQRHRMLGHGP
jgi:hypothetical protein